MWPKSQNSHVTHIVTSHGHSMWQGSQLTGMRTVGDKVHNHDSNCIYSVIKSNGDSIKFSLSNAEQRDSWLNSGYRTLAADIWAIHHFFLRRLLYYIAVWLGASPSVPLTSSSLETVNEFTERMKTAIEEAKSMIRNVQDDMKRYYDWWRTLAPVFKPGDKVFLDASDIWTTCPSQKLSHQRLGPFVVERWIRPMAYRLKLPH